MVAPAGYQASGIGTPIVAGAVVASGHAAPAIGLAIVAGAVTTFSYEASGIGSPIVAGPVIATSHESPPSIGSFSVIQVVSPPGLDASGIGTGLITVSLGAVGYQNPGIGIPTIGGSQEVYPPSHTLSGIGSPLVGSALSISVAPQPAAVSTRCYLFYPEEVQQSWVVGSSATLSGPRHSFSATSGGASSSSSTFLGEFDLNLSISSFSVRQLTPQGYGEFFVAFTQGSSTYEVILRQRGSTREVYLTLPQGAPVRIQRLDFSSISLRLGQEGFTLRAGSANLVQHSFILPGTSSVTMGARASSATASLMVDSTLKPTFTLAGRPIFALEDFRPYYTFEVPPGLGKVTLRAALYGRSYTTDFNYINPASSFVSSDRKVYQL